MAHLNALVAFVSILATASGVFAQSPTVALDVDFTSPARRNLEKVNFQSISMDRNVDFCAGDGCCHYGLCTRDHLTGDLWGARSGLASHGIIYDAQLTQFYQGVADGGAEQTFRYGGKLDQYFILNSEMLGLWQGMTVVIHGETGIGEDVILDAAGLAPANAAMLYPKFGQHQTAITHLQFDQALNEEMEPHVRQDQLA